MLDDYCCQKFEGTSMCCTEFSHISAKEHDALVAIFDETAIDRDELVVCERTLRMYVCGEEGLADSGLADYQERFARLCEGW